MGWRTWAGGAALRGHLLCLLGLLLLGLGLFGPHLLGRGTFIGDADRLNTFLNVRKFSVDSVRQRGRVPSWDDRMMLGAGTCGLHWMLPEADPFAYLEALVPPESLFRVSGLVSCLFLVLAAWTCYFLAYDTCGSAFPAFVGAALYALGAFSVHRIAQVDWAYAVLICTPVGLLILRRVNARNSAWMFLALTGLAAFMLVMTFLQEVAYVFLLLGLYACHRALQARSWRPVLVLGAAILVASVFAFPRLCSVGEDVRLLDRSHSFQLTCWAEVFRWFDDGWFGRYPGETWPLGNGGLNLHEGMQLQASVFATLLVLAGAARFGKWRAALAGLALYGVLAWVFWSGGPLMLKWGLALLGCLALLGAARAWALRRKTSPAAGEPDLAFHLAFVGLALAVILIMPVRQLIYEAFFRLDFTHSRIGVAALPSLSVLASLFLTELLGESAAGRVPWRARALELAGAGAAAGTLLLLTARLGRSLLGLLTPARIAAVGFPMNVVPSVLARSLVALAVFGLLVAACCACRRAGAPRRWLAGTLGCLMVLSAFVGARFQLAGPHTWTFPEPFKDNNYFMAPTTALRPPTDAERRQVQEQLETDAYRTAVVASPKSYFAFVEPHLCQFWGLRLLGGYGAGVPLRLASLPWPGEVRKLRSLSFSTEGDVSWPLLALLNTKYVLVLDDDFYYNLTGHEAGGEADGRPPARRILKNPLPVLPRQFLARSVRSVRAFDAARDLGRPPEGAAGGPLPAPQPWLTVGLGRGALLHWYYPWGDEAEFRIERRQGRDGPFVPIATVPPSGRSFQDSGLRPGQEYAFRMRAARGGEVSAYSPVAVVKMADGQVPAPAHFAVSRPAPGEALLTWDGSPGVACTVEQADGSTGAFAPAGEAPAGASSYLVTGLGPDAYGFRLQASQGRSVSPYTEPAWVAATADPDNEISRRLKALFPDDPRQVSLVEGLPEAAVPPDGFDDQGEVRARYEGDRITVSLTPSPRPRFLVLNELYHPRWRAFAGGRELPVYPTNRFMRGVVVPPGAAEVRFEFTPFLHRPAALGLMAAAAALTLLGWCVFRRRDRLAPLPGARPEGAA